MTSFIDKGSISNARKTLDGYLVADVKIARTGIQNYTGAEVGKPELKTVRVWRPEAEVFHADTMASFASMPMTLDHPPEMVNSANWKKYAVGYTGEQVARDGGFIRVSLIAKDAAAVASVDEKGTHREFSVGYNCDLEFVDGTTPEGDTYDAVQRNIRGNHLALVGIGRAGPDCSFDTGEDTALNTKPLRTVIVDGLSIETTDQGAEAIQKLNNQLRDMAAAGNTSAAAHAAAMAAKDTELGTKDAEIVKLKAAILTPAQLDAAATARADVIAKAKSINSAFDGSGKTVPEIRRAVIAAKLGDAQVKDRSDDYVEALFDAMAGDVGAAGGSGLRNDPVRDAVLGGGTVNNADALKAYDTYVTGLKDGWKGETGRA